MYLLLIDVGSSLPTDELSGGSSSTAAAGAASSIVGGGGGAAAGNNQTSSDKDQSVSASSTIVTPGPTPKSSQPASTTSAATPTPTHTPTPTPTSTPIPGGLVIERSPSAVSDASKSGSDMVVSRCFFSSSFLIQDHYRRFLNDFFFCLVRRVAYNIIIGNCPSDL